MEGPSVESSAWSEGVRDPGWEDLKAGWKQEEELDQDQFFPAVPAVHCVQAVVLGANLAVDLGQAQDLD